MDDTPGRVTTGDPQADRRTRELRSDIEETREEMSETIDAIQEKLRPRNIVASATERVKRATTEKVRHLTGAGGAAGERLMQTRDGVVEGIKHNPIPAMMIGVGAAWLLISQSRSRRGTWREDRGRVYPDDYREYPSSGQPPRSFSGYYSYGERGTPGPDEVNAVEGAGSESLREYVGGAADTVRRKGRRAQNQLQRMTRENPLAVGAGALLLGAAAGLAFPETEKENEWMGETRDSMVDRAQEAARNAASRVQETAKDLAGDAASRIVGGKTE